MTVGRINRRSISRAASCQGERSAPERGREVCGLETLYSQEADSGSTPWAKAFAAMIAVSHAASPLALLS